MKMKKLLVFVLCMAIVASISVAATIAYFTDTEAVTNTFTVGKIGIKLDETKTDEYGVAVAGADRVKANTYKAVPGHEYIKDPTVTIEADSESSFVRMLVTINNMDVFEQACKNEFVGDIFLIQNYVTGWDKDKWVYETAKRDGDTTVYEFRYHEPVSTADQPEKKLDALFATFKLPGVLNNTQVAALDDLSIDVVAHAIQADGFASDDLAWEAYDAQVKNNPNPPASTP